MRAGGVRLVFQCASASFTGVPLLAPVPDPLTVCAIRKLLAVRAWWAPFLQNFPWGLPSSVGPLTSPCSFELLRPMKQRRTTACRPLPLDHFHTRRNESRPPRRYGRANTNRVLFEPELNSGVTRFTPSVKVDTPVLMATYCLPSTA